MEATTEDLTPDGLGKQLADKHKKEFVDLLLKVIEADGARGAAQMCLTYIGEIGKGE